MIMINSILAITISIYPKARSDIIIVHMVSCIHRLHNIASYIE